MIYVLENKDLNEISGGDRWGDGQDWKNHPAPTPSNYTVLECNEVWMNPGLETCVMIKVKK